MSQSREDLFRELKEKMKSKKQFTDPLYYDPSKDPALATFFASHIGAERKTGLNGVADPLLRDNLEDTFKAPAPKK
jgi:hypothetical protein